MRIRPILIAVSFALMLPEASPQHATGDREETVCGFLRERLAFSLWSAVAGRPDPAAARRVPNAVPVEYLTADGRTLRGYRLTPRDGGGQSSGFLLMAQGNAMLADQLLDYLSAFTASGHHVYVYDYRGYGNSEGRRRLKAIVEDYRELFSRLSKAYEGDKLLYGVSFGGIVVSGVIGAHAQFDRAVIDSAPSRVSGYGCPPAYDPVENLPLNATHMLLINGERDTVVPASQTAELLEQAQRRGATVIRSNRFAHPFMDPDPDVRRERTQRIFSFLVAPRE
jgi:alpha-beta hydrolase superfamily lysophospholipase